MFKVLIVDDEINILEGIAKIVDWESCKTILQHKASNGQEAFEIIQKDPPDIVITDIKMPLMNGIKLIEKVHPLFPNIQFIVLSGYDEFEFAKTAMNYGVKHYLLKPSNENKIQDALCQIVEDISVKREKDNFLEEIDAQLKQMLPIAREQLLREFITNRRYGHREWEYYQELFNLPSISESFNMIVLSLDDWKGYEHVFALKEIVINELKKESFTIFSTILSERVILLIPENEKMNVLKKFKVVKEKYESFYHLTFTTAVSGSGKFFDVHKLYRQALDCLSQKFYLGKGSVITSQDIYNSDYQFEEFQFDHEDLLLAVRNGNTEETIRYLEDFFEGIRDKKYDRSVIHSHCLELFMLLIRQTKKEVMSKMFSNVTQFQEFRTLDEIKDFIMAVSMEITKENYHAKKQTQHALINKVEAYVMANLEETSLSISKIANDVLYMNSDYLGKIFKKETGEKFSVYLMRMRMQRAIELIQQSEEIMMQEVAEKVGFGNNPRYFSQVFKKYTGYTPTEYKSIAE